MQVQLLSFDEQMAYKIVAATLITFLDAKKPKTTTIFQYICAEHFWIQKLPYKSDENDWNNCTATCLNVVIFSMSNHQTPKLSFI